MSLYFKDKSFEHFKDLKNQTDEIFTNWAKTWKEYNDLNEAALGTLRNVFFAGWAASVAHRESGDKALEELSKLGIKVKQ